MSNTKPNPHRGYHAMLLDKLEELKAENAALREKNDDWENAVLHAREYRCEEKHCTCVVPLIGKLNQLERESASLREDSERLDWLARNRSVSIKERPLFVSPESLRAAIDAARKEAQP